MERIRIADLAFGGDGVGRLADGSVVFVPFTAVGDDVTVDVTERKQSFCRAIPIQVNEPGQGRIEPRCKHFGKCGGCAYQHLDYETELKAKAKQFTQLLKRIGKLENLPEPIVLPAPKPYEYRNKLRLEPANRTLQQDGYHLDYGYCQRDNQTFFLVRDCPLANPQLIKLLPKAIRSDWGKQNARRQEPYTLTLRIDSEGTTGFYFGKPSPKLPWLHETLNGHDFRVPTGSFWQVNPPVAEKLLQTVETWLGDTRFDTLVDAYGGVGTFSLGLHVKADKRVLIEADAAAVTAADFNHKEAHVPCRFVRGNTEDSLPELLKQLKGQQALIILDPPRTGCHPSVIEALRKHPAATILYVSCNASTLARDLRKLCADNAYAPQHTGVFDMFPRTAHFESATLLTHA